MIAHLARTAGKLTGWSNTDGIYIDGELVEAGDYSGPSGAGRVLAHKQVEFAVTETARGGILLKGIGLTRNDVSVVTNVSADHLGLHGIDTPRSVGGGQGRRPQDHPAQRVGGAERRRSTRVRDAVDDQGPAVGLLARPGLARDPRDADRRGPRHDRDRRLDLGAQAARRPRPAARTRRRTDERWRDFRASTSRTHWAGGVGRISHRIASGGRDRGLA
jgi:hypothetical protein